jgi:ubiquinone/menaquinone biosynthesis C-methylase UbiE
MLDELAHAGAEHLDADFVAGYDRKQGYPDPAPDIEEFVRHGLGSGSTVIDLAAGTGQFSVAGAATFGRVIAVDVSPAMVAFQQQRAAAAGTNNVEVVRAGFFSYEHPDSVGQVDGVYTRNALHQVPDFWKGQALDRINKLLKPGGVLRIRDLIYDFAPSQAGEVFSRWFDVASDDPALGYTASDYAEHIRLEHSTYRWLFEPILEATGFEIERVEFDGRLYGAYTCVKR